jgi:hypothetical protein
VDTQKQKMMVAVERGAALLDERVPDWRDRIDRDLLDMTNASRCVLGMVYSAGYTKDDDGWSSPYGYGLGQLDLTHADAEDHGFTAYTGDEVFDTYSASQTALLQPLWLAII